MILPLAKISSRVHLSVAVRCIRQFSTTDTLRKNFPIIQAPLNLPNIEEARSRSLSAEQEHLQHVFLCQSGGGEKGVARHVELNKKILVRDRLRKIIDEDDEFFELSTTSGLGLEYGDVACGGTITGIGKVNGVSIMFFANDATVKGGTSYPITVTKSLRAQEIAEQNRIPCFYLVDSGGAFLPLQAEIFPDVKHGGRSFRNQACMSAEGIAQLALVAGLCTAGAAYTPTMSDQAIMVHKIGNIYLGGPPLVKAALGEVISGEELGGARLHSSVSGIVDYFAATEDESFQLARECVESLNLVPTVNLPENQDPPVYSLDDLDVYAGLKHFGSSEIRGIIARIIDGSRFSEFKKLFGANLICGFGHIGGQLVGILADCGRLSAEDGQKGGHFVQLCDLRGIPMIFLQNNSSSVPFDDDYRVIKERSKFIHCQATSRVPKISINIGGVSGDSLYTMCGPAFRPRFYFSWPLATMTKTDPFALKLAMAEAEKMKAAAAAAAAANPSPAAADKPKRPPSPPLSQFNFSPSSAQFHASRCTNDGVVLPRETRKVLLKCLAISMLNYHHEGTMKGQQESVIRI